jgi:hypothetical protein
MRLPQQGAKSSQALDMELRARITGPLTFSEFAFNLLAELIPSSLIGLKMILPSSGYNDNMPDQASHSAFG